MSRRPDGRRADGTRDCTLVLLTLDEIDGLHAVWEHLPLFEFARTLVVDGGSTDGTVEFLRQRDVEVVGQPLPGRGVAFRVAAEATDTERLVFFSPDGNEDPADITRLDDLVVAGADLAIARRFGPGAVNEETGLLRPRARVNQVLSWLANRAFNAGEPVADTINGFRAMRRAPFFALQTSVKRYPIEYQITIRAMRRGWKIAELPTREGPRIGGRSKAISWPVGADHLKVLVHELPSARPFAGDSAVR